MIWKIFLLLFLSVFFFTNQCSIKYFTRSSDIHKLFNKYYNQHTYNTSLLRLLHLGYGQEGWISFLVLRRRVSAKRRTIVFSTVRPSLQQRIGLPKKFQVFYTFNRIIRPMNHVCLWTPRCTTLYGRVLAYPSIDFVFLWHMQQTYIGAVLRRIIFFYLKIWNFCVLLKNSDFGELAH